MIESSFLSPSAWESDAFPEFIGCSIPDINSLFNVNEFPDTSGDLSPCSNDFSSSSDDLLISELNFEVTDEFVSGILQDTNAVTGFSDLDWLPFKNSPKKSSNLTNTSSPSTIKSKKKPSEHLQSSKLWSDMSEAEQLETLHALSEIVTSHMLIREQMEVIKIIDPSAIISPDVKEFALDSTYLDDIKLERIKDFLKKQTEREMLPKSIAYSSLKSSKKVNNSSKLLSRKSNNLPYSRTKRKQKKEDNTLVYSPEDKQLKLKRRKQTRKEQKSGFFVYEKKMKLVNPQEDDEDVNILE